MIDESRILDVMLNSERKILANENEITILTFNSIKELFDSYMKLSSNMRQFIYNLSSGYKNHPWEPNAIRDKLYELLTDEEKVIAKKLIEIQDEAHFQAFLEYIRNITRDFGEMK